VQELDLCKGVLEMSENYQPAFRVYSVIPREGKDDYWLNIGLAFPHQDGKGFNVMLQALPLNAKLVLREVAEEEKEQRPVPNDRTPRREVRTERPQANASRSGKRANA
jgi:hypothetical protein